MTASTERIRAGETDGELLDRYRRGELAAVGTLYRRYCRPLHLYALSLVRDPARAEDIVQQSFVRLLQQDPARIVSVRGLLYATARNLVRDEIRRAAVAGPVVPLLESAVSDEPAERDDERMKALSRALNELPAEQREVVILRIYGDLPFAHVAEILEVPEATAKSRYRYALGRMEELLDGR